MKAASGNAARIVRARPPALVREGVPADSRAVGRFYASVGYSGSVEPGDRFWLAREGRSVIGAVRLASENGVPVLRGLYVAPSARRSGVGRSLRAALLEAVGERECFCIPFSHLRAYYAECGFGPVDASAPAFLKRRLEEYRRRGLDVLLMRRPARPDSRKV